MLTTKLPSNPNMFDLLIISIKTIQSIFSSRTSIEDKERNFGTKRRDSNNMEKCGMPSSESVRDKPSNKTFSYMTLLWNLAVSCARFMQERISRKQYFMRKLLYLFGSRTVIDFYDSCSA